MIVETDLRISPKVEAVAVGFSPTGSIPATNVQDAIEQVAASVVVVSTRPPAIVATQVNFAMSPYTVLSTDYLIEVDTSGGAVDIQTQASATRANLEFEVKDVTGNASTNNIRVLRTGAELIDGLAIYPIASDFGAYHFKPRAVGYEVI